MYYVSKINFVSFLSFVSLKNRNILVNKLHREIYDRIAEYLSNDSKPLISINKNNIGALLIDVKDIDKINKNDVREMSCKNLVCGLTRQFVVLNI